MGLELGQKGYVREVESPLNILTREERVVKIGIDRDI